MALKCYMLALKLSQPFWRGSGLFKVTFFVFAALAFAGAVIFTLLVPETRANEMPGTSGGLDPQLRQDIAGTPAA